MPSNIEKGEKGDSIQRGELNKSDGNLEDSESWMNTSIRMGRSGSNKTFDIQPIAPPEDSDTASSSSELSLSLVEAKELPVIHNAEIVNENDPVTAVETQEAILDSTQLNSDSEPTGQQHRHEEDVDGIAPDRPWGCMTICRNNISVEALSFSRQILPRTSLPYSIEESQHTPEWIVSMYTDQNALDNMDVEAMKNSIQLLNFNSNEEAREACHTFAPPRMHSLQDSSACQICKKTFGKLFRKPWHCKNCGVCVCNKCNVVWSAAMVPKTFNMTRSKKVRVCLACNWLHEEFRMSLLNGQFDRVVQLHATGNLNLRSPFSKTKGEIFYPVHCAVQGGNLQVLQWLVDERHCPITTSVRSRDKTDHGPVLSSTRKSVFDIAMANLDINILCWLIVEKKFNIYHCKNMNLALKNLKACLRQIDSMNKTNESAINQDA